MQNKRMLNARDRRKKHAREDAAEMIGELGEHRAAVLLNVHLTTVRRWASGEVVAQTPVLMALRSLTGRQNADCPDWAGWRFSGNFLHAPSGERFVPGDLYSRHYEKQLIAHYQGQIKALQDKLAAMETLAANEPVAGEVRLYTRSR